MIDMRQIEKVGKRIGERFRPHRVILFGSYAGGHPTKDSDVDLLIVMPVDQSVAIRLAIRPPFPLDLLVRTPKKVRERLKLGDPFMRHILSKGKVLYEAAHT